MRLLDALAVLGNSATPSEQITSAMTTGFTSATNDIMGGIASILPIIIPVVGAILLVTVGYRLFKRFGKG